MFCSLLQREGRIKFVHVVELEFHEVDIDTDILARILADTSDTHDFRKLFLWKAERPADILATILARTSARTSVSVSCRGMQHQYRHRLPGGSSRVSNVRM